MNGKILIKSEF